MANSSDPNFPTGHAENDQEHDASQSAALVAVNLISSARLILKLDSVYTEYSAQYLLDNASSHGQGGTDLKLTVKDCLEFALKEGIPKAEGWPHLGCLFKPPSLYKPALIPMKGEVIEGKELEEAYELLMYQPVGAKLHVFSPQIDLVGDDGIYYGPSIDDTSYIGLRDVIIASVENIGGKTVTTVKICYKKKIKFIKVNMSTMFLRLPHDGDISEVIEPTGLLVDFCVPRLSID